MMYFDIQPFECVGPLSFRSTAAEVAKVLGEPSRILESRHGGPLLDCLEHSFLVDYDELGRVVYFTAYPEQSASLRGIALLGRSLSSLRRQLRQSGVPFDEGDDSIYLTSDGISVQYDEDEIKNVSVFSQWYWEASGLSGAYG